MGKKLLMGCGLLSIGLVLVVVLGSLLIGGVSNEVDNVYEEIEQALDATVEQIEAAKPDVSITCEQIKDAIDGTTDFQRDQYLEKLHGKVISWQGQVRTVDEMLDIYVIFETADGCEIRLDDLDAAVAGALIIDQWYTVGGPIKSWSTLFGLQAVLKTSESTIE